ncbi:MAG: hypothetical protein NT113_19885 [Hyphomicrobiales bacterium]|nr:hypothetical protein [Hyphomicrobiales bacterium]
MTATAAAMSHNGETRHFDLRASRAIMFKQKHSVSIILCNTETASFLRAHDDARHDFTDLLAAVNAG